MSATRLRGTYDLSTRRKVAVLLREAADRFDERSLTGTAAMLRRSALEIDEAEWEIARLRRDTQDRIRESNELNILADLRAKGAT